MYSISVQNTKHNIIVFVLDTQSISDGIASIIRIIQRKPVVFISLTKKMNSSVKDHQLKSQSSYYESFLKKTKSFVSYISLKNLKQFYYFFKDIRNFTENCYLTLRDYYYKNKLYIIEKQNVNLLEYEKILLVEKANLKFENQSLINTFFKQYKINFKFEEACLKKHPILFPIFNNFVAIVVVNCEVEKLKIIFSNFVSKIESYFFKKLRNILMLIIIIIFSLF
jgi:hypothetical protein